jgi:signal transduction histidine kinase
MQLLSPHQSVGMKHILRNGLMAAGYGAGFYIAHRSAAFWGGSYYFSLFYPAAGLRFALLWHFGARFTPLLVLTELLVQVASGIIQFDSATIIDQTIGVARGPIFYGLAVALVRWIVRRGGPDIDTPPMPFALATVLAPISASLASVGSSLITPGYGQNPSSEPALTTTMAFMVGDLLGVLMLAPPLLFFIELSKTRKLSWNLSVSHGGEAIIIFAFGWALALAAMQVSLSLMMTPIMLATIWIGLRCGRTVAWLAILFVAILALPLSQGTQDIPTRLALHMGLAAVAIAGYLAGSFADAQRRAQADITRRDRMLFQAERLKTLRAMSVAVIHEISQPLSTLSIESRYLAQLGRDPSASRQEIGEIATLLEGKVATLSDMVRRLRRFGGRAVDEPSIIAVSTLIEDMAAMIRAEARKAGIRFSIDKVPDDLVVLGQGIELVQALVNVVRNAIAAAPGGLIEVTVGRDEERVMICITNDIAPQAKPHGGMGVGSLVARAIVEAHGGQFLREDLSCGRILHRLALPCSEPADV